MIYGQCDSPSDHKSLLSSQVAEVHGSTLRHLFIRQCVVTLTALFLVRTMQEALHVAEVIAGRGLLGETWPHPSREEIER